ncbi:MAG TPA: hypothetical protein DCO77_13755 [Nitrospiraceae bacterium]|nr:hypothetical protein [Nitrospiraceae bacterium]
MSERKRALLICHTTAGQMYLGVFLNRIWFSPTLAKTAEEGVLLAKSRGPFSLIILDGDLPEDILNSTMSLLRSDETAKDLPLVVITSDSDTEVKNALIAQGCSAVLTKPLDIAFVYGVLGRLSRQLRKYPRVPIRMQVEIEGGNPEKALPCTNISEEGLYLRTHAPLPHKTVLGLHFTLPHSTEKIRVSAEVARALPLGIHVKTEPGMGLRFLDLSDLVRQQIRNFVHWQLIGDLNWEPDSKEFKPAESV